MIEYRIGNDLKLRLAFVIEGVRVSPDLVPFDIKLWTLYPSQAKYASYDGTQWVNCLMREDYLEVNLNAPQFNTGRLNADITLHYPDDDMPDKIRDKIVKVRFDNPLINPDTNDVVITGEVSDTIAGLSAYGVAVWNGYEGTEEEWLQSLKQPAIDAANEADELMNYFANQEHARANEENARKQSELARVAEEQNRVNQELARANEENTRKQSELARVAEEQNRVNQELARVDEENTRKSQEIARQNTIAGLGESFDAKIDKTSIKQVLGTSTTDVMSQKATTDNLELKIDKTAIVDKLGTDPNKIMSQKATTDAIMKSYNYDVNLLAYGVRLDLTSDGKTLVRVGNLSLHKTRPITSKVKNCVKNVAGVNYYLSDDTDLFKADGVTPSVLDGTDGDVMKEIPELYVREYTEGNYAYTYISEFPLPNFIRIPKTYHGLYEGSYNTTTKQTRSVINATIRTGLPATGQSRSYYNNGARLNRNTTWNIDTLLSNYVRELLFRVDYATYNSQAPYNSQPTAEGYLQGGLGAGVTTLDGRWEWNGYNPFIPCGYTSNIGNKTGVKDFTMPYGYEAQNTTTHINWYKGVYNQATIYNVGEYVSDKEDTTIGQGDGKLYKCIQQTTAGIPLTNTAYFTEQVRTKVQVNRFLVEMPFGHTFKHTIDSIIELTNAYTTTKCYIYDNPEHYPTSNANDTKTANARFLCDMPSVAGYVKTFNKYTLVPYSIGGSSNSWSYDYYYWRGEAGGALRGLLFGGNADNGAGAGFGCSVATYSPAYASATVGVRLCCFEENIVINS